MNSVGPGVDPVQQRRKHRGVEPDHDKAIAHRTRARNEPGLGHGIAAEVRHRHRRDDRFGDRALAEQPAIVTLAGIEIGLDAGVMGVAPDTGRVEQAQALRMRQGLQLGIEPVHPAVLLLSRSAPELELGWREIGHDIAQQVVRGLEHPLDPFTDQQGIVLQPDRSPGIGIVVAALEFPGSHHEDQQAEADKKQQAEHVRMPVRSPFDTHSLSLFVIEQTDCKYADTADEKNPPKRRVLFGAHPGG